MRGGRFCGISVSSSRCGRRSCRRFFAGPPRGMARGRPLRRGRSSSCASRRTATRTAALRLGVARDGLVSFVQQVVSDPPVEQLGLLDLARGLRLESSVLGYFSASPRTPAPPAVLRKHRRPLPTGPHGRGLAPETHGAVHGSPDSTAYQAATGWRMRRCHAESDLDRSGRRSCAGPP